MPRSEEPRYIEKVEMEALDDENGLFAIMTLHDDRGEQREYAFQEEGALAIIASIENWLEVVGKKRQQN